MMKRISIVLALFLGLNTLSQLPLWAQDEPSAEAEFQNGGHSNTEETEQKNIIPDGDERATATQVPTAARQPSDPFEQAQAEVVKAYALFNEGKMEASSDKALEAFDDLRALPRKVRRQKQVQVKKLTEQAASVYLDASIAYVKGWLKKEGRSEDNLTEARSRLEDVRSVASHYLKLNKQLNQALLNL